MMPAIRAQRHTSRHSKYNPPTKWLEEKIDTPEGREHFFVFEMGPVVGRIGEPVTPPAPLVGTRPHEPPDISEQDVDRHLADAHPSHALPQWVFPDGCGDPAFPLDPPSAPSYYSYPATEQEQPLMYSGHVPYSDGGAEALEIQQSTVSPSVPWDMFYNDPDTWGMYSHPPWPAINTVDQVVPPSSSWHMPGVERVYNLIKYTDTGAAQAMQHQYGCNSIGLCTHNMHVQSDCSLSTIDTPSEWSTHMVADDNIYNSAWIPYRGADDYQIQAQSDWVDDTTPTWYCQRDFAYDHPVPQASSSFEPIPTTYWDFNGATQYPELAFSSNLPFEQASSDYQPMAAAYWDYEASSMEYNGAGWNMNTTETDLYSSDVGTTDINAFNWAGVSGLDGLVSQQIGRNMGVPGTLGGFA